MNNITPFTLWLSYLKKHWKIYSIGCFFVLITNIMQVLSVRYFGWIIDFFNGKDPPFNFFLEQKSQTEKFYFLFFFLIAVRALLTIGRSGWRLSLARQTHFASSWLRENIWNCARFFKSEDLQNEFSKGNLMNNSNSDVSSSRFLFGFTLVAMMDVFMLGLITLGTMLFIDVKLTICSILILIFLPFFIKKLSKSEIKKYKVAQDSLSYFNELSTLAVSTTRLQRLTHTGRAWSKKLIVEAEKYRAMRLNAIKTSLLYTPVMGGASVLSYAVLFGIGIRQVFVGEITVGEFISMQGLIFLLQDPLMELGFIISEWKKGFTSLERLVRVYNHPQDKTLMRSGEIKETSFNILDVKNLHFKYQSKDHEIIRNLSFTLKKGEKLGITGPIGAGKTTLIQLISGLERRFRGEIEFLGKPFDVFGHEDIRKKIIIVPQKSFLFADSIRNNITMDHQMEDEHIWHHLELAGLKSEIENFSDGLDTELGEWGVNLSGGQKQRLTLARALSRKPELLILDDCLSAVDTVTEEFILENLKKEFNETTMVWIAHRKSTLRYCDRILELGV